MTDSQPARGCELKFCPFCGGPAEAYSENAYPHHKRACCLRDDCPGTHVVASPGQWNTRVAGGGGDVDDTEGDPLTGQPVSATVGRQPTMNERIALAFPEPLIAIRVQDFVAALQVKP